MDLRWQPVTGVAQRRRRRRLRAAWRHEQQSIAQALAAHTHRSAPRRQTTARARGEESEMHIATGQMTPLPRVASTEYFSLDVEDVPRPAARCVWTAGACFAAHRGADRRLRACCPSPPHLRAALSGGRAEDNGPLWSSRKCPEGHQSALALYAPCPSALLTS